LSQMVACVSPAPQRAKMRVRSDMVSCAQLSRYPSVPGARVEALYSDLGLVEKQWSKKSVGA
jgi:hypothetical protein